MENQQFDQLEETPQTRPTFLTVLCILSWVGGGWAVLSNLWSAAFGQVSAAASGIAEGEIERAQEEILANEDLGAFGSEFISGAMEIGMELLKYQTEIALTTLILSILSIIAVVLMWNLKKAGFYLYLVANVSLMFVPAMFVGFNWVSILAMGATGFFGLVFIILYAVNLKHMNN